MAAISLLDLGESSANRQNFFYEISNLSDKKDPKMISVLNNVENPWFPVSKIFLHPLIPIQ